MKTLKESLLDDIEDTLTTGDSTIKKVYSAGSKLEICSIYGELETLDHIDYSKVEKATKNFELYYKSQAEIAIRNFDEYFCHNMLSKAYYEKLWMLIMCIENIKLDSLDVDFNDKKVKAWFCDNLNKTLKKILTDTKFDVATTDIIKGIFKIVLISKAFSREMIIFSFKIKK